MQTGAPTLKHTHIRSNQVDFVIAHFRFLRRVSVGDCVPFYSHTKFPIQRVKLKDFEILWGWDVRLGEGN